jgi:deazaflavin-dependent oxidoreductase (nitroreductase family)
MEEQELAELDFCYLTTTGRRSGHPHTIEIWFGLDDQTVYLLCGGGDSSDWVKNLRAHPTVGFRLGDRDMIARARVVDDLEEDSRARKLLLDKYSPRYEGDLSEWGTTALPVAVDLPVG